jgi:hypothetical protein
MATGLKPAGIASCMLHLPYNLQKISVCFMWREFVSSNSSTSAYSQIIKTVAMNSLFS